MDEQRLQNKSMQKENIAVEAILTAQKIIYGQALDTLN